MAHLQWRWEGVSRWVGGGRRWAEEVGALGQPPGEPEWGGPARCPELEEGAGSREGTVLLCQGRRLLPEGAVTLNREARLAETAPNKST